MSPISEHNFRNLATPLLSKKPAYQPAPCLPCPQQHAVQYSLPTTCKAKSTSPGLCHPPLNVCCSSPLRASQIPPLCPVSTCDSAPLITQRKSPPAGSSTSLYHTDWSCTPDSSPGTALTPRHREHRPLVFPDFALTAHHLSILIQVLLLPVGTQ